ncbi:MAG: hypothetical protein PHE09_11480 [Oscillospiraceae bacterium]|nr:hypothetical protein [Oscillospiraceae bacterium]
MLNATGSYETQSPATATDVTFQWYKKATVEGEADEKLADSTKATYTLPVGLPVGTGKTVTVTGITLEGSWGKNYALTTTTATGKADITKKSVAEPGATITPTPGADKHKTAQNKKAGTSGSTTPATEDSLPVIPLLLLLMISGATILRLNYFRRKNGRTR